jgi:hypothetical protein
MSGSIMNVQRFLMLTATRAPAGARSNPKGRKHRAITGRRLSAGMLLWLSRGRNWPVRIQENREPRTRVYVIACPAVASS